MNKKIDIHYITQGAIIATLYVVLTLLFAPISFSMVQVRISEALCVLPYFTPAAIPGLFVGCLIANLIGGAMLPDIIFGSLATLLGAFITYWMRKLDFRLAGVGAIVANTLIIPFILRYAYGIKSPLIAMFGYIALGEILSAGVLGVFVSIVYMKLQKTYWDKDNPDDKSASRIHRAFDTKDIINNKKD